MKTKSYTGWLAVASFVAAAVMLQAAERKGIADAPVDRISSGSAAQAIWGTQSPIVATVTPGHRGNRLE
jgi:hypothetical protein